MSRLRVPRGEFGREQGRPSVYELNLNRTCHVVCDICAKSRRKGNHEACSKQRQIDNAIKQ